jgi:subtilisin family serine protease
MRTILCTMLYLITALSYVHADASVSPSLFFERDSVDDIGAPRKHAGDTASVTVRFDEPPGHVRLAELESQGLTFSRGDSGNIRHTTHIYPAAVSLDRLESLAGQPDIVRIEHTYRPWAAATLDVSNPQVQASLAWPVTLENGQLDGSGVVVATVDTGIDLYHPGFFKPDGGTYNWIDTNNSGLFDAFDAVDLNTNGQPDPGETLSFYDAYIREDMNLPVDRFDNIYDADLDWLYNDANENGKREYGPDAGFTESDPCFGERVFVISDTNGNNRLDPGETLTGLGTSKVRAVYDNDGAHERGTNLLTASPDATNHGTGASSILCGGVPGQKFVGMAPGLELICINRTTFDQSSDAAIESALLWAQDKGVDAMMYEFGSWVFTPLDGTANLDVMIDDFYAQGIHQFTAAGNLAGPTRSRHSFLSLTKSGEDSVQCHVPIDRQITEVYLSFHWQGDAKSPVIKLTHPIYTTHIIRGTQPEAWGPFTVQAGSDVSVKGTERMDIRIQSSAPIDETFTVMLRNQRYEPIDIHCYIADNKTNWMNGVHFENHLTDYGTICSPGTAEMSVTVGAYDPRGTRNDEGGINDFSSRGPTVDGRLRAVDITAPGSVVYSYTSHMQFGADPGAYYDFGGTSSALPHVVGCAALLMQAVPDATPMELEKFLYDGALEDTFTGPVPNDTWGWGKLRILDSLHIMGFNTVLTLDDTPSAFTISPPYPNPFNAYTTIALTTGTQVGRDIICRVYNLLGQEVYRTHMNAFPGTTYFTWDGTGSDGTPHASGMYIFRFDHGPNHETTTALLLK